jgi:hypothetical protein
MTGKLGAELTRKNVMRSVHQLVWNHDRQLLVTAGGSYVYEGKIRDVATGHLKATFQMIAKMGSVPFTSYNGNWPGNKFADARVDSRVLLKGLMRAIKSCASAAL